MIKICPVGSALRYTPFNRPSEIPGLMAGAPFNDLAARAILQRQGVEFCDEAEADILISGTFKGLIKSLLKYGSRKQYLIWTIEPRFDTYFLPQRRYPLLPPIHVLNLYSGLLTDNYFFFPEGQFLRPLRYFSDFDQRPQGRRMICLMTYQAGRSWRLPYQGKDLDLCNLRTEIAIAAHRQNRIDIHGRKWPQGIGTQGDSRGNRNWRKLKTNILGDYHFNLCFENTNWPYYCSEKIWQAIQGGCLPIYYGDGNRIYDDFPTDSFIDYAKLGSPEALFWFLDEMLPQEFLTRYNRCVAAYNLALERHHATDPTERLLQKTLAKLQEIAGLDSKAAFTLGNGSGEVTPNLS
jgi:alpha(1,3/1,4) fucosyltransferase